MQNLNISRMSKGGLVGMAALEQEIVLYVYTYPYPTQIICPGLACCSLIIKPSLNTAILVVLGCEMPKLHGCFQSSTRCTPLSWGQRRPPCHGSCHRSHWVSPIFSHLHRENMGKWWKMRRIPWILGGALGKNGHSNRFRFFSACPNNVDPQLNTLERPTEPKTSLDAMMSESARLVRICTTTITESIPMLPGISATGTSDFITLQYHLIIQYGYGKWQF